MAPDGNDAIWDPRPRLEPVPESESSRPVDAGSVLVELVAASGLSQVAALAVARGLDVAGFRLDEEYGATPLGEGTGQPTYVVRGQVDGEEVVTALERDPRVARVWRDTPVAPF